MNYIQGTDRKQIFLFTDCLDHIVAPENEVRAIDIFVNSLDMKELGFVAENPQQTGRPAYNPSYLLKLYIYSYMNRTRSSREIEKETKRNIEVMWLINNLHPDHNTIANFRKDNSEAIRKVFEATLKIAKNHDLIGGKLIAGDSVKLRAQNSKKNNFNKEKLENQIEYLNKKIDEYNQQLEKEDTKNQIVTQSDTASEITPDTAQPATTTSEQASANEIVIQHPELVKEVAQTYVKTPRPDSITEAIKTKIERHKNQRVKYNNLLEQLSKSEETQISTSDPDSRNLPIRQQITEICHSIQTTADAKHKILLDYQVTNKTDKAALFNSVERAAKVLETNEFVALYDKGYFSGAQIAKCQQLGVEVMVSIPPRPSASEVPTPKYYANKFVYNKQNDTFLCPEKQILTSNGTISTSEQGKFKHYRTTACRQCPALKQCTNSKKEIRIIERSEYADNVEYNKKLIEENKDTYRLRQEIIEHPFGTMKRQWGYDHTIMKRGKDPVAADIGLIFVAYNLRRLINILLKDPETGKFLFNLVLNQSNLLKFVHNKLYSIFNSIRNTSISINKFFPTHIL